jgi:hypothetical protein
VLATVLLKFEADLHGEAAAAKRAEKLSTQL